MKKWKSKSGYEILRILSGRSNVFVLTNGVSNILIDTSASQLWNSLDRKLSENGIKNIGYLVLTHAHYDHAGNAKRIKDKFNALVIVHSDEAEYLSHGDNVMPQGTNLFTRTLVKNFGERLLAGKKYEPCVPDLIADSVFDLSGFGFSAYLMHTPGHTVGSMCLVVDDEIAIAGDALFGVFRYSAFPPYAQDVRAMLGSWRKLLDTKCRLFLPSHGSAVSRKLLQKDYEKRIGRFN